MNILANCFYKLFPKPLSKEVIEVFDKFGELEKIGLNDEDPEDIYHYLRMVDLCKAIRKELFSRGILFTASDRESHFEQIIDGSGRYSERCTVVTDFAATRGKDRLELGAAKGSARGYSDKSLAIAQTAAFKAMLKRSSMTYGKEDDPEQTRETMTPREAVQVAKYQRRALKEAMNKSGLDPSALAEIMSEKLGFEMDVDQIADFPPDKFDEAIRLILHMGEDLSETWSAAVVDIQSKKKQCGSELVPGITCTRPEQHGGTHWSKDLTGD